MRIIMEELLIEVFGKLEVIGIEEYFAAAPSSTILGGVPLPSVIYCSSHEADINSIRNLQKFLSTCCNYLYRL